MKQYQLLKLKVLYPFEVDWPMFKNLKTAIITTTVSTLVQRAKVVLNVRHLITYYSMYDVKHDIIYYTYKLSVYSAFLFYDSCSIVHA